MASIYDLIYDYIARFYPDQKVDKETRRTIHREIKSLLKRGWCSSELFARFKVMGRRKGEPTPLVRKLVSGTPPKKKNLLDPDAFYYHNLLRVTCKPPSRSLDVDSGIIINHSETYFLEMRASLTMEELVEYYCRQFRLTLRKGDIDRMMGSFRWLLQAYTVEEILFMIDMNANNCLQADRAPPRSPLDIKRYLDDAIHVRSLKKSEAVLSGGNEIVRKKRMRIR